MQIAGRKVGVGYPPVVVAEMSGNHNQSLDRALAIVDAAADAGAHALKLQTYTAETMTLNLSSGDFFIADEKSLWQGRSLYELYEEAHTPWDWHAAIFERCRERNLICFSAPFDTTAVDFLETLSAPAYKIASFENADLNLIKRVARTGKPLIISTGMASVAELDETVRTARDNGCTDLMLLKCTSSYPATPETTNIRTIPHLRELFDCEVGLSDHTKGIGVALASIALGATMVEKHFTLARADGGVDSAFSIEPPELKSLVEETERAWQALGKVTYGRTDAEKRSLIFRRSLYVSKPMKKGETFSEDNLRSIRPGKGLAPKYFDTLLGKRVKADVEAGTAVSWDLIE
ncbi:pseudaminic acid synthase [candidate division GN15 bacterium]|nr:pseudaminic acid synthase [candidate division GN15 bacterium]